eukprot:TRINITY_DN1811_c0_g1_i1.p1 TRINITY_DN1811_c0_g1~~TRINITY_DN1811_c0_g1_i1.p1  ORF type:complete len:114 (-),score=1.35 TRINITY_DN1811_c0_g1_i1:94-435(-)
MPCTFPFSYRGVEYFKCTNSDFGDVFWCATTLFSNGATNAYGVCVDSCERTEEPSANVCQTISRQRCVFPFNYGGNTYTACTDIDYNSVKWCATSISKTGEVQGYGSCGASCS